MYYFLTCSCCKRETRSWSTLSPRCYSIHPSKESRQPRHWCTSTSMSCVTKRDTKRCCSKSRPFPSCSTFLRVNTALWRIAELHLRADQEKVRACAGLGRQKKSYHSSLDKQGDHCEHQHETFSPQLQGLMIFFFKVSFSSKISRDQLCSDVDIWSDD